MDVRMFGLEELARDFRDAEDKIGPDVKKVTSKTCLEIKKRATRIVTGHGSIPNLGRTFNYDVTVTGDTITGEVGADITKKTGGGREREPGSIDFVIEYGGIHNAPIPHWRPAAEAEVPLWERYLGDAAEGALDAR